MSKKICINGDLGSGKTTISKLLRDCLGFKYYSTGEAQRNLANSLNISTLELNRRAESDDSIDKLIDSASRDIGLENTNYVVDSRMAWHFVEGAIKVRLVCHPRTSAQRIFTDKIREAEVYKSLDEALQEIAIRRESEQERFIRYYNIHIEDLHNYDLIVQADLVTQQEIVERIIDTIDLLPPSPSSQPLILLNPQMIFPFDSIRNVSKVEASKSEQMNPVTVLYHNDSFFVIDGHHRLAATLLAKGKWITARLANMDDLPKGISLEDFVKSEYIPSRVYDWEDAFGYRHQFYPEF